MNERDLLRIYTMVHYIDTHESNFWGQTACVWEELKRYIKVIMEEEDV